MILFAVPLLFSIITGDRKAESVVQNTVSGGNVKVQTNITTSVNGKVATVSSDQSGTVQVKVINDSVSVTKGTISITPFPTAVLPTVITSISPQITIFPSPFAKESKIVHFVTLLKTLLTSFFSRFFIRS